MAQNAKEKKKQKKKRRMEWAIAHNLFIRFSEAFLSKHILVLFEPQILLHLLSAKWYTFQPEKWYIIQPVRTIKSILLQLDIFGLPQLLYIVLNLKAYFFAFMSVGMYVSAF